MPTIKFSHTYNKLIGDNGVIDEATLLQVLPVNLEDLTSSFLSYDTDNGVYSLPKKGKYLMLIFLKDNHELFTTLRRSTPQKENYYKGLTGKLFTIEYTQI